MYITNHPSSTVKTERPDRPVCSDILISGEWLAVCILRPGHSPATTCLPSPYLGQ